MELKDLYDLIRKEPVCLFIGSGFSLYTGMPSVSKLIDILYDDLTLHQQKKIIKQYDLRKFSDDYETLFGRAKLVKLLQRQYDIVPSDKHLHDLLAKISHFKAIFTTNYDRLIEDSKGTDANVLVTDTDVFNPKQAKCRIFKIHGDIRDGESIIISNTDYSKHYNRNFKDPFWASIIAELSSKHVIFLGYGYEDENIWADFSHIEEKLKSKGKKRILISPGAKPLKKKKLKHLKIDYIKADGETFINGLIACLKRHIFEDHRSGIVDTQTAQDFITSFDMKVAGTATKESAGFTEISRVNGPTHQSFKLTTSDSGLIDSYEKFTSGYQLRDLIITPDQLETFAFLVEDFNFFGKDTLAQLKVAHVPKSEGFVKIFFPDQNFTLHNVHGRLFNSIPGNLLIETEVAGFRCDFNVKILSEAVELNFKFTEPEQPVAVAKTYEVMHAFYLFFAGERAEIIPEIGEVIKYRLTSHADALKFKTEMEIFRAITKIEKCFNVEFPPLSLGEITKNDEDKIRKLRDLIHHGYYAVEEKDGLIVEQMPRSKEMFEGFKSQAIPESYVSIVTKSGRELELFGQKLQLGAEQVSMKQPTPVVLDFDLQRAQFIPIDHVMVYHYEKFGHWEMPNAQTLWNDGDDEPLF